MRRSFSALTLLITTLLLSGCDDGLTNVDDDVLNCDRVRSYSIGSSTSESLSTSDCELDGVAVDYYRVQISRGRDVQVTMTADRFDPYVVILDDDGFLVAEEDDFGSGFSEVTTYLSSGTYYVAATSYDYGEYGQYRLRSEYY